MMDSLPADVLEKRAADQRRQLHNSIAELRTTVRDKVRSRLDYKRQAREHLWPAIGVISLVGLTMGYGTAGMFTKH
jgi:hypothetical protein